MSINPETDLNLDELFQPSWAKESGSQNPYAKYEPKDRPHRGDRRGRDRGRNTSQAERRSHPPEGRSGFKGGFRKGHRTDRREAPPPLPEINVTLQAERKGAESLARQIKTTGRAYPLFDIARMILQKPDRFCVAFAIKRSPEGNVLQPLFTCALDQSIWLSEDDAVAHVLRHHLSTFYQTERTEIEAPKGTYTFVAQCGMSGTILGPPNHHDYQTKLHELHSKRFSHLPFETYKSRVKIVRDEAVVNQWVEDQSWKTEYTCLNVPEETRLTEMAAVEKHFRETHLRTIINQTESHTLPGKATNALRGPLYRAYRAVFDQQRRFPMQVATSLSQQFAAMGLQFFKVNKTVTHVWVARPTFLDLENEPVSDSVRRIVQFINEHPKCTRRQVIETLAPSQKPPPPAAAPSSDADSSETQQPPRTEASEPTPDQAALIGDLHWLIHQGHVIEFANGLMETAKKPAPKPPHPSPKKKKPKASPNAQPTTRRAETVQPSASSPAPKGSANPASPDKPPGAAPSPTTTPATPPEAGQKPEAKKTSDPPAPSQPPESTRDKPH